MGWRIAMRVGSYGVIIEFSSHSPPSRIGWRLGGKRASERWESDYLDWALADFSGYLAADELYDGPFCVLSIVDNRTFKRLFFQVLDHDPKHEDLIVVIVLDDRRHETVLVKGEALRDGNIEGWC